MSEFDTGFPDEQYIGLINSVERSFSKKYETAMFNCIIKVLKEVPIQNLNAVVEKLVMNSRYFPKVPDWVEATKSIPKPVNYTKNRCNCDLCLDSKWVLVGKNDDPNYEKAYRCSCSESGFGMSWDISLFKNGYYLVEAHNLNKNPYHIRKKFGMERENVANNQR